MSANTAFLPSRDLRDLRTLDLFSAECLHHIHSNLESLAHVLGASGGRILHPPPHLLQSSHDHADAAAAAAAAEPPFEHPPTVVDSFEKSYVTRWLTRLISESTLAAPIHQATAAHAEAISEPCAQLLALAAGRMAAGASVHDHVFQLHHDTLTVKLRDGALVHDSLGTHTWGAAPILSQLMLPLHPSTTPHHLNVLELGAGTGLVGLAIALWCRRNRAMHHTHVVCTDYHPTVLENLAHNIALNGWTPSDPHKPGEPAHRTPPVSVVARCLDWHSVYTAQMAPNSDLPQQLTAQTLPSHLVGANQSVRATVLDVEAYSRTFDMLVAADCVYDPVHPFWIRAVAEKLLRRCDVGDGFTPLLHVMVPLRPTHQREMQAVYQAFQPEPEPNQPPHRPQLVITSQHDYHGFENFGAWNSVVRCDDDAAVPSQPEGGLARTYRWFQIGWRMC